MKEEVLKLADEIDNFLKEEEQLPWGTKQVYLDMASTMIRRLVEEVDKKQQGLVEASAMLVNYKYELDLERTMSAQLKEELEKQK